MHYEPSLVVFTVLIQLSAGLAFMLWAAGIHRYPKQEKTAWRLVLACGAAGLIGAMLHLSNIFAAPYALTQAATAWLSREIWAVSIFGALVLLRVLGILGRGFTPVLALLGLGTVYVVSQVYRVPTVPFWNTWGTELGFFGTALALGSGVLAVLLRRDTEAAQDTTTNTWVLWVCVLGLLLSCAMPLFGMYGLSSALPAQAVSHLASASVSMGLAHAVAAAVGCGLLLWGRTNAGGSTIVALGAVVLITGEVIGRMLFYAANFRVGM